MGVFVLLSCNVKAFRIILTFKHSRIWGKKMTKNPRLKRWLLRTGIALGFIVLLLFCAAGAHSLIADQKLKSVYAQLRQDSIPLTWEEYYKLFPNVEAHLAAQPQFFAALDNLSNLQSLYKLKGEERFVISPCKPELGDNATSEMLIELENYVSPLAPALGVINEAVASEPLWRFMPNDDPSNARVPSRFVQVRDVARQFQRTAILHAERNEPMEAAQAVVDGIQLAEVLNRSANALDAMIRFILERTALQSLEYVLAKTDPPRKSLLEVKTLLSKHSGIRNAMLGEFVFVKQNCAAWAELSPSDLEEMIMIEELTSIDGSYAWEKLLVYLTLVPGWMRMNEAYCLELFHSAINNWNLPWQDFKNRHEQAFDSIPWVYFLPNFFNTDTRLKKNELGVAGSWACGHIAVAIELYSQEHGKLPDTLDELVPKYLEEVPGQPFCTKPLAYKKNGNAGTLSFSDPGNEGEHAYTFRVFANRESIPVKE